jgi:hypothetical protein
MRAVRHAGYPGNEIPHDRSCWKPARLPGEGGYSIMCNGRRKSNQAMHSLQEALAPDNNNIVIT